MNTRRTSIPILLMTAALVLVGLASAQDRDRRGDDPRGGARHERAADFRDRGDGPSRSRDHDSSHDRDGGSHDRGTDPFGFGRDDRSRDGGFTHERPVIGSSSRDDARNPSRYDGRGRFAPTHFSAPPRRDALSVAIGASSARRVTHVAIGAQIGGLRVGYVSYAGGRVGRRDAFSIGFGYGHYVYDPYAPDVRVVATPWYRYSYLPPYLDDRRVIIVGDYPSSWDWSGWRVYDRDRRDDAVSNALDDLRDAFEENSDRVAERLVPESGEVAIFNDGRYDYSLSADDFDKMFLDGVDASRTSRYEILEVRTRGDEVRVRARHEFTDSWGDPQTAIHRFTLRRDRGGDYVIREFGTK